MKRAGTMARLWHGISPARTGLDAARSAA